MTLLLRTVGFACAFCAVWILPAGLRAETNLITLEKNELRLLASPFAAANGNPLAVTALIKPATGGVQVFVYSQTNFGGLGGYRSATYNASGWSVSSDTNTPIARGDGFWLRNSTTNPIPVTFTGTLSTALAITNRIVFPNAAGGPATIGYPYLAAVAITNLNLTNDIRPYVTGTVLYVFAPDIYDGSQGSGYRMFFYDADGSFGGGWQDADDPGQPTDYVLTPMEGFWILSRGQTQIVWRAVAPP